MSAVNSLQQIEQYLQTHLPHQDLRARPEEWLNLTDRVENLAVKWMEVFNVLYDGDPARKADLGGYIYAKMQFILVSLNNDAYRLNHQCENRRVLANKEIRVIEEINNVVSHVLKEDMAHQMAYAEKHRKNVFCFEVLQPNLAEHWNCTKERIKREINYQPPSFLENLKTVSRCISNVGKKPLPDAPLVEPSYEEFMKNTPTHIKEIPSSAGRAI